MQANVTLVRHVHRWPGREGGGGDEHVRLELATPETSGRLSTNVRHKDFWDFLGNFCGLQLVNSYLINHGPIITQRSQKSNR